MKFAGPSGNWGIMTYPDAIPHISFRKNLHDALGNNLPVVEKDSDFPNSPQYCNSPMRARVWAQKGKTLGKWGIRLAGRHSPPREMHLVWGIGGHRL
jgi:hypothetical protein